MYPVNKGFLRGLGLLLATIIIAAALWAAPGVKPAQAADSPINSAVQYLDGEYTTKGLVNTDMGVGSYAFYVLHRAGVNVSDWEYEGTNLEEAVIEGINKDLLDSSGASAKLLAQDLAAAVALGDSDLIDRLLQALGDRESSAGFDQDIYSDIPAYELLGRIGRLDQMDQAWAKECILKAQNRTAGDADYGSFGGDWGPDFMSTAQAIRALHYLDPEVEDGEIQEAIIAGLHWLQDKQQTDGGFLGSKWDDPVTDTAEVIITLTVLGMAPDDWEMNGCTAVDYMLNQVFNAEGGFIAPEANAMDATWTLCAYSLLDIATPEIPISPADYAQEFLRDEYTRNGLVNTDMGVGSYAFYVLHQAGVDVGDWQYDVSLEKAVVKEIDRDLSDPTKTAKLLAQDLAAAVALGDSDLIDRLLQALGDGESSAGFDQDIYSDIPAYELLGRIGRLEQMDQAWAKEYILKAQNKTAGDADYGSFGGDWGPDFMSTAQAIRALHYLDPEGDDSEIQEAIDVALHWLEAKQRADGGFLGSEWDDPVTDTAEVIITLTVLGMVPDDWEMNGCTAVDYMLNQVFNAEGGFIAPEGNAMDATWALCAYNLLDNQFYLSPGAMTMKVGDTVQFKAVRKQAGGPIEEVTPNALWSVADSAIVSVDEGGLVTALAEGSTKITAIYSGLTASVKVTVGTSSSGGEESGGTGTTVGLAVVGLGNQLIYGPSDVSVDKSNKWGLTALGVLDASGLDYQTTSWSYGDFVCCIEGQASSGLSGWMYTVNGTAPGSGADKYGINNKDKIIFYYSESMDQQPPSWDQLGAQSVAGGGGGGSSDQQPKSIKDSDLQAAIKKARDTGQVTLAADDGDAALVLSGGQVSRIYDTGVPLAVAMQGVQFILAPECLKVKELPVDQSAMLEFTAQKLSSEEAEKLVSSIGGLKLVGEIYELKIQVLDRDGTSQDIAHFPDCLVCLPIMVGMDEEAAAGLLKAYCYNEDSKQWENVGGTYDGDKGLVSFHVNHFSKYALLKTVPQLEEESVFVDTVGHWAQAEIEYMATAGYVAGVGGKQFAPEAKITRAEFTAILTRMAGLVANPAAAACFNDVPVNAWYRGAVGAATAEGLVYGSDENSFAPDELVTREQMAAILVRFMAKNGLNQAGDQATGNTGLLSTFSDGEEISPWAQLSVAQAVDDGLLVGREKGQFAPQGSATRAEATVVLYRALQKLP